MRKSLRVVGVRPTHAFARLGLDDGDLLVSANGRGLHTVDDAYAALETFVASRTLTLELVRAGATRTHVYWLV